MNSDVENYWDENDLEEVERCPVCGAEGAPLLHQGVPDLLERVPGRWDVARCNGCRSVFLKSRPRSSVIHKAYRSYYTHQSESDNVSQNRTPGWIWSVINAYLNRRYGCSRTPSAMFGARLVALAPPIRQQLDYYLRSLPTAGGRLLDIGCGNGAFLLRALDCSWEIHGVEPDPEAAKVAKRITPNIFTGTFESFRSPLEFDAITASHVIEHVYDPSQFAKHALSFLKPGGMLWLSTPNAGSIGHKWFKSAWRGLEPPRHISILSASALVEMLRRVGFEKVRLHRRGRGSQYIIRESARNLKALGDGKRKAIAPLFVDLAASAWPTFGEELVVTGVRPGGATG